jgi:isopenicillin N synthase-like dioxygenase
MIEAVPIIPDVKMTTLSLSVLDLVALETPGPTRDAFIIALRETAHDLGFFYDTGHGISPVLIEQARA